MSIFKYRNVNYSYIPAWYRLCQFADKYQVNGIGLDIGCGKCCFPNAIGIDPYFCEFNTKLKCNGQKLEMIYDNSFDFLISSHSIEHMLDWKAALLEWLRVIKFNSLILLLIPDPNYFPWSKANNKHHNHDIYPSDIKEFINNTPSMQLLEFQEIPVNNQYYVVIQKIN